jgi:Glycosyl transferase family 2
MSVADTGTERPIVSVIVPARNEESSLGACLKSLVAQKGVPFEIIVVDDGSTDRTREIALSFAGVRVVEAGPLPEGWSGKNHAVTAGAKQARGQWFLFTDADTVHLPYSLVRSLGEARRHGASLLSYSPEQEVEGFWERAVMPVIFAELALAYQPSQVSNPNSPAAAANGQYLLVSREAYDAAGGHAAVAGSLLEDVALARAVKASGRSIFFRYGGDAVRTRMYRTFAQLREGWTKNLTLLFPSPGRLAAVRMGEFVLIAGSAEVAVLSALYGEPVLAAASAVLFLISCATFVRRIRQAHSPSGVTASSLLGLPLFAYLLLRSRAAHRRGTVTWKGRNYAAARPEAHADASPAAPAASKLA